MLHRELYRGALIWGKRKKRDQWGQHRVTRREEATWTRRQDETLRIVPEDLWEAALARLDGARKVYLRGTNGRLWGRPANGIESRWLLTGFGRCGCCGGTLEVRSLDSRYRRRSHFYQCASYVRRGASVCANRLPLPMERAHAAILDAIEADVLNPDVVEAAIREAMADLRRPAALEAGQETALRGELREIESQIANVTKAVKLGGSLASLVTELQALEQRRSEIQRTLKPVPTAPPDAARLRKLMAEWCGRCSGTT